MYFMTPPPVFQPAGNYYDKYAARNPLVRWMMRGFMNDFDDLVLLSGVGDRAIEIGCGEGELSIRLARKGIEVTGCDIAEEAIIEARARAARAGVAVQFEHCGIEESGQWMGAAPLVVCCEVLEHLDDTSSALDALSRLSTGYLLVSVPREPIWRVLNVARLRYLTDLGNTPGHIKHWSRRAFVDMLSRRFEIIAVRSPLPWTMVLCRVAG
ncbi:methyltransferase domain-containing protein [Luteibacter sp. SG786]|uniref:class I SAM-dependent methyltransferase n=1 Tax=Luteibacter sp. SG786 TaxID=2587130 RepID=UPI001ABB10FA|nr:methyltransferase domain-containing protein [Luteibacter sp. SG786]NII56431.1 2-polyprenyl-3-methyl-5-hydroxy-6-metoxy-1,4-benzoquinol methylase [Luteibacter sp. SG786]